MLNTIVYLLSATLRMGTPIAFTALGGLTSERSGVINIGLEGIMLASAFGAVVGSYYSGSAWVGVLVAILLGVFISFVHSIISITWGGNQSVSSMALVLLATGLSGVGVKALFGQQGTTPQVANLPKTPVFYNIPGPVGKFLGDLSPFVYIAFISLFVVYWLFKHTRLGLRIVMVGENPRAAETAGLNVHRIRYFSVLFSGVMGGLGGAMLSIGAMNLFQDGMVAGRGYLAMGAVSMGRWHPIGVFASALFFGLFDALQLYIQTIPGNPVPSEFVQMIPYVASLVVLAISMRGKTHMRIAASNQPYTKYVQQR